MSEGIVAALAGLVAAGLLKLIDHVLTRNGRVVEQRKDLRMEVHELWARLDAKEKLELEQFTLILELRAELAKHQLHSSDQDRRITEQSRQLAHLTQESKSQRDRIAQLEAILKSNNIEIPEFRRIDDHEEATP